MHFYIFLSEANMVMCVVMCIVCPSEQCVPCWSEGRLVWSVGDTSWTCRLWSRAWWRQVSTVTNLCREIHYFAL